MKTVTIQAGNSDDKLTQAQWAGFVAACRDAIERSSAEVHFFGASAGWERWQNAAWVIAADEGVAADLRQELKKVRSQYAQDSIAWTEGETDFI